MHSRPEGENSPRRPMQPQSWHLSGPSQPARYMRSWKSIAATAAAYLFNNRDIVAFGDVDKLSAGVEQIDSGRAVGRLPSRVC